MFVKRILWLCVMYPLCVHVMDHSGKRMGHRRSKSGGGQSGYIPRSQASMNLAKFNGKPKSKSAISPRSHGQHAKSGSKLK